MQYDHLGLDFVLNSSPGVIKAKVEELAKRNHIAKINSIERKMLKKLQEIKAEIRERKEADRRARFPR